jgi:hypothetical protein
VVKCWFIEHHDTEIFLSSIGFRHLKEGIDFADSGDILRNERLKFCVKIDLLRFIPVDVFKELFRFATDREISELRGVVGSGNFLLIIVIFVFLVTLMSLSLT